MISCNADMALWIYNPAGISYKINIPNPLMIDLFTLQYATDYYCTNVDTKNRRVIVKRVTLRAYGELSILYIKTQ